MRRAVDDGAGAGSFLLTGSASPTDPPTHSGAGRIVRMRLRPMTLAERDVGLTANRHRGQAGGARTRSVSLRQLLQGDRGPVTGRTEVNLERYVQEILASGFPGLRGLPDRVSRAQLDGYVDRIVDRDFEDLGRQVRRPGTLREGGCRRMRRQPPQRPPTRRSGDAATSDSGEKAGQSDDAALRETRRQSDLDPRPCTLHGCQPVTGSHASLRHPSTISPIPRSQPAYWASMQRPCCARSRPALR